jgi:hypothetical protein
MGTPAAKVRLAIRCNWLIRNWLLGLDSSTLARCAAAGGVS